MLVHHLVITSPEHVSFMLAYLKEVSLKEVVRHQSPAFGSRNLKSIFPIAAERLCSRIFLCEALSTGHNTVFNSLGQRSRPLPCLSREPVIVIQGYDMEAV